MTLLSFIPHPKYTHIPFSSPYYSDILYIVIVVRSAFSVYITISKHYSELRHDVNHDYFSFPTHLCTSSGMNKKSHFLPLINFLCTYL